MLTLIASNVLPKLYAISAMWTLNSREKIRRTHSVGPTGSSATGRRQRSNNFELSSLWVVSNPRDSIGIQMQNTVTPVDDPSEHSLAKGATRFS